MASDTATARADRPESGRPTEGASGGRFERFRLGGSRLGGLILAVNLASLLILFVGALALNEWSRGLIQARQQSLSVQGELLVNLLGRSGAIDEAYPVLNTELGAILLGESFIPRDQRARLFDIDGHLITDSYSVSTDIPGRPLERARPAGTPVQSGVTPEKERRLERARAELAGEVERALDGQPQASLRLSEDGDRVVSVSIPVRQVRQVVGVLTLETGDVDAILGAQRRALLPFAFVALAVNLLGSLLLHLLVARPVKRLSAAADAVRLQQARAISLPELENRRDEIGDLARSLETMTETLSDRMDAIEAFAADVSHEIKNPLTSIRSALETLSLVKTAEQRDRLTALLQQDVRRLDRLITDISNASRLDAELSRDRPRAVNLAVLLTEIVGVYRAGAKPGEPEVRLSLTQGDAAPVMGRDGPLGQVIRNLIDNARSFSPVGGQVRVSLFREEADALPIRVRIEDDGPGIPADNLETVFERFYTSRPKGAAFGTNSGLGLSIVRQIVEAHGGRVWAENRIGEDDQILGARFEVALPSVGRRA